MDNIYEQIRGLGFYPRRGEPLDTYIKHLNLRLKKKNEILVVENGIATIENYELYKNNHHNKKDKYLQVRISEDEYNKYKELSEVIHKPLSSLVRKFLNDLCKNNNIE